MSAVDDALRAVPRPASQLARISGAAGLYRLQVYAACTVLAVVTNYLLGKDLLWDTLNYHVYSGFSALNDRFGQDYFGAGPWSYLNPYVYAPFYLLLRSGLPALAASSLLAAAHSTVLWLTYELALCACPSGPPRTRAALGACAVSLAFLNPVLIQQIGSSFADISTAVPVLGSWLLLALALHRPSTARILCAGLLIGVAVGLKLTNSVHAMAALVLLAAAPGGLRARVRLGLGYGLAAAFGFALVAAPWAFRLARTFGNPAFPLLNGVFRSPEFPPESLFLYRFVPGSLTEALWRPFAMINPAPLVHVEDIAPDLRYGALLVVVTVLAGRSLSRRVQPQGADTPFLAAGAAPRVVVALGCALAVDWVLWLRASGNSRYFLPMSSVAAVVLVTLLFGLLAARHKLRNYLLAALGGLQLVGVCIGAEYRWTPLPWGTGPWFQVDMPHELATEPSLYLTMGMQSNSFLAPFLAPGAALVNFSGGYVLGAQGASGARVEALIRRYAPRLRVLVRGERLYADGEGRSPNLSVVNQALRRFAVRVVPSDCKSIAVHGLAPEPEFIVARGSKPIEPLAGDVTSLVSCRVVPDDADDSAEIARRQAVDRVFAGLEEACPQLFQPRGLLTEHTGTRWQRYYLNTDLSAWVSNGKLRFRDVLHGDDTVELGRESDWNKAPLRLACGRADGHYFARVLDAKGSP